MKIRLLGFAAAVIAVAGFAIAPSFADEAKGGCCEGEKAAEKKAEEKGCCKEEAAKKAEEKGCCKEEAAKADEKKCDEKSAKEKGCDGCGENVAKMSKAMVCSDCTNSEGPCAKCKDAVDHGKVFVLPVKGMSCGNCEGAVAKKLEGMETVGKYYVNHRYGVAVIVPTPGKTIKLSEMASLLASTKEFSIDETAPVKGCMTLHVTDLTDKKAACAALEKLAGDAKKCTNCSSDDAAKTATFTIGLGFASKVSIKDLRAALGAAKIADIEFRTCGEGKCEMKGKS